MTGPTQSGARGIPAAWHWLAATLPLGLKLPVCILVTIPLLIISWIIYPFDPRGARLRWLTVFWAKMILRVSGVNVKTAGLALLDPSEQYVFASNHASWIDIPVLLATVPKDLAFIAKRDLFDMPLVGACLRRTGQIAIDRSNTRGFADGIKKAEEALTRSQRSVTFFPAGTRAHSGVGRFKDGAAYFAIRTKLAIVPVGISGTDIAMPRGTTCIKGCTVHVTLGRPVVTADLTLSSRAELTNQLQQEVTSLVLNSPP